MSDYDGHFMWDSPSSPSPRTILTMLNQTDNDINLMNEIFPQGNLSNDQFEQRPHDLEERLASSIGFNPPTLQTENISQTVPSSQIIPPSLEVVESSNEGNAATMILNNDNPPQEEFYYILSPETNVEPLSAPLVASIEHDTIDEAHYDFPHQSFNSCLSPQEDDFYYIIPSPESNFGPLREPDTIDEGHSDIPHQPGYLPPPQEDDFCYIIPSLDSHVEPLAAPLVAFAESETVDEAHNDLSHDQPMNVDMPINVEMPTQEEFDTVDEVNIISMEEESKSEDKEKNDEEKVEDHETNVVNELNVGSSSSKKRKFEGTNMIGTTRNNKAQRIILQMESEEDNPDDGFHWRKYGQKVVRGNPNPRSYYKCQSNGCKVKKRIERGAEDDRLVITSYEGIHNHPTPPVGRKIIVRRKTSGSSSMKRSDSSMSRNRTASRLSKPSSSVLASPDMRAPFSSLGQQTDMTKLFMTGLSKLPSLPVNNQNLGFTYRNEEPMTDAIPDGTAVFNRVMDQVYAKFGSRLSLDML